MSRPLVSVADLGKTYTTELRRSLAYGVSDVAREVLGRRPRGQVRPGEFWALQDVGFELERGESLAILGHNGAGKTTLLRLLFGLLKPDAGRIHIRGRPAAMLELGSGINDVLTGRENIEVASAVHGLPRRSLPKLLDEVIAFAELDEFIDAPLRSYSAGMKARLGYSIAAHLRPDVLLIDEVLAVGDHAFQRKCFAHMRAFVSDGGALLLVSHNGYQAQTHCEGGLLLDGGRVAFSGSSVQAVDRLLESGLPAPEQLPAAVPSAGPISIEGFEAHPTTGPAIEPRGTVRLRLRYRSDRPLDVTWGFGIWTADQWVCVTAEHDPQPHRLGPGAGELSCRIPELPLVAGRYWLRATVLDAATNQPLASWGWNGAPSLLSVTERPTLMGNAKRGMGQLTHVHVDWNRSSSSSSSSSSAVAAAVRG